MITVEDKNYLTVKEFAAAANISNKAVYQQLKTRLKEYELVVDDVKMISEEAIQVYYNGDNSVQVKSSVKSSQVDLNLELRESDRYITYLEEETRELKEQLRDKDKTILEMQQQIINLSNSLANMSNESLQQIASITKNIQLLQVAEAREDYIKSQEGEVVDTQKKSFWDRMRGK